jgi:hypothetical protein
VSVAALVGVPHGLRSEVPPPGRQTSPDTAAQDDLDLTAAVVRLASLGVTVRCDATERRGSAADWDQPRRTVTLRPDLPVHAALWVLRDLYALATEPEHVSPSAPARWLTVAR